MRLVERAPSHVRAISPYLPGKPITQLSREMGIAVDKIVKLASNENPQGMSPRARTAVEAALTGLERYPDQYELTAALAERLGVGMDQIVLGNGSNDVLDLVARVFLAPGCSSLFSQHAFAVYPLATMATGAECIVVPARDYGHDLEAMRAAIRADTRVVWIANPNNPTGNFLPAEAVRAFLKQVPEDVVVVLDEAYNEYLPEHVRADTLAWVGEFANLLITRTFSKIHGLAGLRIGYGVMSAELAGLLHRVRQPFNVNNLALAGALAALDDEAFIRSSHESNRRGLEQLMAGLKALGLEYIPSYGNFLTFKAGDAAAVNAALLKQGVIVRPIANYSLPQHLRVTVGLERENRIFLQALEHALEEMSHAS